jgi:hypothetical protein
MMLSFEFEVNIVRDRKQELQLKSKKSCSPDESEATSGNIKSFKS